MGGPTYAGKQRAASSVVRWSTVDVTCTVFLLMICFTCTETTDCGTCVSANIMEVQKECLDVIVKFEEAISAVDNVTAICKSLVQMYYCVGELVPQCILNFTTTYKAFHQSPHDCHISTEAMTKLQKYRLNANCNMSGTLSSIPSQTTVEMTSQSEEISTASTSSRRDINTASGTPTGALVYVVSLSLLVIIWTFFVSTLT
ncbi:uncharacterized protein LOC117335450 [Pecten maximus]|uniref:uncharacterized protein LOC117335450 n=1 Tax=Pecten maximus TaxID=6579 RepID=UPI001458B696|nr:uncharacterized protein LOC117335450 [Pecten maximus]